MCGSRARVCVLHCSFTHSPPPPLLRYIVQGLLFKLAVDPPVVLPSPTAPGKTTRHHLYVCGVGKRG